MRHWVWVSFDLGIKGDYESMYRWLDGHGAVECGENVAGFWYKHTNDLLTAMKKDLSDNVELTPKSRIYVIRLASGKMKGKFLFGTRHSAPWSGFGGGGAQVEDSA